MNYPFIKLTFTKDDSTYDVRREFIVKDSLVFDYKLLNGIDPSSNRVQFQLTKDCPINEKIIGSDKDVKAQVCYWDYDTGVPIVKFTGYISNNFKWGVNEYGKSVLNITLEDIGTRKFKKPFNKEKAEVLKGTLNEVINIICQRMQIERADKLAPETQVICVISKGKKVEEILKTLVKENVYTYYFDENGKFNLYPINYSKNVWDYNIKKDTLYAKQGEAISFSKSPKQYTHSEVEWKKYAKVPNITVLRDGNGKDDSHPNCNIIVKGYETYPAKDNGKPANIKATDLNSGKEIVYIENLTYDINTPIGDFTKTVGIHDDLKSIKIAITNNSASDGQIEKLECYADAMLVQGSATAYGVPEGDLNLDTYKTKSEWLHDEAPNKKYAEFLALYYAYCNHSYTFYTKENMELGKVCRLQDETFSGLDVNVLLTSKRGVDGGIYTYTGFATTQFNIAEVGNDGVTFPDVYPEGVPGPSGPPGKGVSNIEEFWAINNSATVAPTKWETTIPTPTVNNRYLWYYSVTHYSDGSSVPIEPGIISVMGLDGESPVLVTPSFTKYEFPVRSLGGLIDKTALKAMVCEITVTQDSEYFTVAPAEPLQNKQFIVTAVGHGISEVYVDNNTVRIGENGYMTPNADDSATIDVSVKYRNKRGIERTYKFVLTLKKKYDSGPKVTLNVDVLFLRADSEGRIEYFLTDDEAIDSPVLDRKLISITPRMEGCKEFKMYNPNRPSDGVSGSATVYATFHNKDSHGVWGTYRDPPFGPPAESIIAREPGSFAVSAITSDNINGLVWGKNKYSDSFFIRYFNRYRDPAGWHGVDSIRAYDWDNTYPPYLMIHLNYTPKDYGVTDVYSDRFFIPIYKIIEGQAGVPGVPGAPGAPGAPGLTGAYTAFEYYASTSDTEQVGGEWSKGIPSITGGKFLFMRSQVVPAGGSIDENGWGEPVLAGTDISLLMANVKEIDNKTTTNAAAIAVNAEAISGKVDSTTFNDLDKVVKANSAAINVNSEAISGKVDSSTFDELGKTVDANTAAITANSQAIETKVSNATFDELGKVVESNSSSIKQTADKIALTVDGDGNIHPNSKQGASIVIGNRTDGGYIFLDAPDIITPGTITANEINTEDLYSNIIEVGDRIVSGGYREVDEKGNINPRNLPGFYADASGTVKMIDAEIKGTIDSDILTTINGIPEISSANISPEYKTFWNDAQAVFDPEEWYETPQHVGLPENSMSASLVSMGGSLFYENSYSEYGLYRSDDLYSWTRVSDYDVKLIDYQNGEYYGWVLDDPKSVEVRDHYLAKSATGSSWTKINTPYIHYYENFNSKLLTPNIWLLLTDARYGQTQYNYYSTDKGETWNSLTFFNNTGYSGVYGVYGNGKFIVSADVYSSDDPDSWRIFESTDGINWTKIGSIPQKEGSYYNYKIKFDNGYFYKINSSRSGSSIDYSTDGINWKTKTGLIGDFTALKYIPEVGLWVARGKNYILYSPTINGEYKAVYTSAFGSCNVSYPVFADNKIIFLLNNRSNNGMSFYYCSKWARGGITNFFSRIIPKIAPGNRAPTYEPLWDLQSCTGGYVYGNITGQLSKIKSAPNELILIDTNGSVLTFNTKRPIEAPLQITNLVIKQIQAIAYLGNVLPKDSNVNLGTNDNRFRTIYAMNLYGSLEGNVNSEATRNQFKVWGAVAN